MNEWGWWGAVFVLHGLGCEISSPFPLSPLCPLSHLAPLLSPLSQTHIHWSSERERDIFEDMVWTLHYIVDAIALASRLRQHTNSDTNVFALASRLCQHTNSNANVYVSIARRRSSGNLGNVCRGSRYMLGTHSCFVYLSLPYDLGHILYWCVMGHWDPCEETRQLCIYLSWTCLWV